MKSHKFIPGPVVSGYVYLVANLAVPVQISVGAKIFFFFFFFLHLAKISTKPKVEFRDMRTFYN